ncbi:MAG: DUF937 domain-containing protein [Saprospiraceae bacterium]|nr:DUF937 domain-containing protein [Saprospiraceae bacterium]MBK8080028.1 DUF937 domain-containing protein [Saprospiraceae bacterium]MBK8854167.1 DUF937 domain-containing protein [Saprospiraceae bacterium]
MNIEDLLQGPLKNVILDNITSQLGVNDTNKASSALDTTINVLMNAMAKNASNPDGAGSLVNAVTKDHDGSILDNITDYFSGQFQPQNPSAINGKGILDHLLGGKQETAASTIGKETGMDAGQIMKMMAMVAPILMGVLGKANQNTQNAPSGGGLIDMLLNSTKKINSQSNQGGLLSQILDKDGDGSIMDDVAGMGFKSILGRLFRR